MEKKNKKVIKKVVPKKEAKLKITVPAQPEIVEIIPETEKLAEDTKGVKRFYEGVGRRKTAIAQVRLFAVKPFEEEVGKVIVNEKPYKQYFVKLDNQQAVEAALRKIKLLNRFEVTVKVKGGGLTAQAEAIRHGISRALLVFNADFRKKLKKAGYLKRDPRMKERRKFGLKKARRAPQWAKR